MCISICAEVQEQQCSSYESINLCKSLFFPYGSASLHVSEFLGGVGAWLQVPPLISLEKDGPYGHVAGVSLDHEGFLRIGVLQNQFLSK